MTQPGVRLPFGPLEAELIRRHERAYDKPPSVLEMAMALGVSKRQVHLYRAVGITVWQADRLAVNLHLHPMSIWGAEGWLGSVEVGD